MIKEIKYAGFSAVPSDYACPDGDLALSMNLINEDGALHPLSQPKILSQGVQGARYYIHDANNVKHYLWVKVVDGVLLFGVHPSQTPLITVNLAADESIIAINSITYFVVISTSRNLHYFRFNATADTYQYLGTTVPDIKLQFGISSEFAFQETSDTGITIIDKTEEDKDDDTTTAAQGDVISSISTAIDASEFDCIVASGIHTTWESKHHNLNCGTLSKSVTYRFNWAAPATATSLSSLYLDIEGIYDGDSDYTKICSIRKYSGDSATISQEITLDRDLTNVRFYLIESYDGQYSARSITLDLSLYKVIDSTDSVPVNNYSIQYDNANFTALKGALNKFIAEKATGEDKFMYPFFARYAIVLYDGTIGYVSPPTLLTPNSTYAPALAFDKNGKLTAAAFVASLYGTMAQSFPEEWQDLIYSVDIYVSLPLYTYDEGEEFDSDNNLFRYATDSYIHTYGSTQGDSPTTFYGGDLSTYLKSKTGVYGDNSCGFVKVSAVSDDDWLKKVANVANFYRIKTIELADLKEPNTLFKIEPQEGCIASLAARPTLKDEPYNYSSYVGANMMAYNKRLNITPSNVGLPTPPALDQCNPLDGTYTSHYSDLKSYCIVTVYLRSSYGERKVMSRVDGELMHPTYNFVYFYPDTNAYKVEFQQYEDYFDETGETTEHQTFLSQVQTFSLKKHDFLNFAYYIGSGVGKTFYPYGAFDNAEADKSLPDYPAWSETIRPCKSMIYYSPTANPFVLTSSTQIGQGNILNISTSAKALSQGQFGQFPLYAFTDEGVWALSVDTTGEYLAKQIFTRDVVLDLNLVTDSITQIDSAVLFATDRGIMLLSGSETQCLTDSLDNLSDLAVTSLPQGDKILSLAGFDAASTTIIPFKDYIKGCCMVYDYVHQRIIVCNQAYRYAYVFSLKSKLWGMMQSNVARTVNSYPSALALDNDGQLIDFSASDFVQAAGLLVSRPIKLDAPDVLKTIDTVIQRGVFVKGHVQQILQGSRDCLTWFNIWTSKDQYLRGFRGTPYKYFRMVLLCNLNKNESLIGASIQYNLRLTDQMR